MSASQTTRKPPVRITPGMVQLAARLVGEDVPIRVVAERLGCSYAAARNAAARGGAKIPSPGPRPTPVPDDAVAAIVARYRDSDASMAQIVDDLNAAGNDGWPTLTTAIVRRVLRDAGLTMRRPAPGAVR